MSQTAPHFRCFPARPLFSPVAEAALYVGKRARGFLRARGLEIRDIRSLVLHQFPLSLEEQACLDAETIEAALVELRAAGYVRRVDATRWKFERCAKHRNEFGDHVADRHEVVVTH